MKMSIKLQATIDKFWHKTIIFWLPQWVKPDLISLIRLALIPTVIVCFYWGNLKLGLIFFIIAALCDSLDGSLARKRKIFSPLGKIIDPFADKALTMVMYLLLLFYYAIPALVAVAFSFDVLYALSAAIIWYSKKQMLPVIWLGKVKMAWQLITAVLVGLSILYGWWFTALSALFLSILIALQIIVYIKYVLSSLK